MTDHYFSEKPRSNIREEKFIINLLGNEIAINSCSGLFSMRKLDFGTRLLIENTKIDNISNDSKLLDLGCGYGIIGIAFKKKYPKLNITMIDINERAVRMAKQNCKNNNLTINIFKSDILNNSELKNELFDVITTNPPFSAGKNVCMEFIRQSYEHLNKGGKLHLVAPHNKGGDSLKKYMCEVFNNVGETAKKSGFRVYFSIKK